MNLGIREKLVLIGVMSLILLMTWLKFRSALEPEDKWWERHIAYKVMGGDGMLAELWSRSNLFVIDPEGLCLPFITAAQKKVFVIGAFDQPGDNAVLALDAADGTLLWHNDNPDRYPFTGLYITSAVLYSGSIGNATLRAYDLATGQVLWASPMPWSRSIDCFRVIDQLIYVETNKGRYLVQADTGEVLHRFEGAITVEKLNQLAAQLALPALAQIKPDYFEAGVVTEETIFRRGAAYDRRTGKLLWQAKGAISDLAVTPAAVYVLTKDRKLLGLHPRSGAVMASVQFEPQPTTIGVHGFDNAFYVAADADAGLVYAFLGDGAQLFAFRIVEVRDD